METMYNPIAFSPVTTLTASLSPSDTIISVANTDAFPPAPNYATIGTDADAETIRYAAKTGNQLSGCVRGVEGTAKSWESGEYISRNFTAKDHKALIANINELDAEVAQAYSPTNKPTATDVGAYAKDANAYKAAASFSTVEDFFRQLGLTGDVTTRNVLDAIPYHSLCVTPYTISGTLGKITDMPFSYGTLICFRGMNNNYELAIGFETSNMTGDMFVYNAKTQTWSKNFTTSGGTVTGDIGTEDHVFYEKLSQVETQSSASTANIYPKPISIKASNGQFLAFIDTYFGTGGARQISLSAFDINGTSNAICLTPSNGLSNAVRFERGENKYNLYGEHNKPTAQALNVMPMRQVYIYSGTTYGGWYKFAEMDMQGSYQTAFIGGTISGSGVQDEATFGAYLRTESSVTGAGNTKIMLTGYSNGWIKNRLAITKTINGNICTYGLWVQTTGTYHPMFVTVNSVYNGNTYTPSFRLLSPSSSDFVTDIENGSETFVSYAILPTPINMTYTGNGSSTERIINTGIKTKLILITESVGTGQSSSTLVTLNGGISWYNQDGSYSNVKTFSGTSVYHHDNGELHIQTTDSRLNASGTTYTISEV